jgi:hypothetical protein
MSLSDRRFPKQFDEKIHFQSRDLADKLFAVKLISKTIYKSLKIYDLEIVKD